MTRRTKILIAAILVLVLGFLFLRPGGGHRRALEAYKKELRAKGEKLTFAEIVPPRTPDESNGAALFTKAMNTYTGSRESPERMRMTGPGVARTGHTSIEPALMTNYASNVLRMAELRTALKASILDFNLDYSQGYALMLTHLPNLKKAVILASDTAIQAMHGGDFEEARLNLLASVDLVRLFRNEPIMISDLVRIAMTHIAASTTWDVLQSRQWTEPQLAELQTRWEEVNFFANQEAVFAMNRANAIHTLAALRKLKDGEAVARVLSGGTIGNSGGSGGGGGVWQELSDKVKELYNRYPRFWVWKSSWSYDEELFALRMDTAGMQAARRLRSTEAVVPAISEFKREESEIALLHPDAGKHFSVFVQSLFSSYERHLLKVARAEASRRLLVTAIALKRYHLQQNSHPARLDELVPTFLQRVPIDPMDGKPLRYQLNADGSFLLYSVGEDGKDGDGDATGSTMRDWTLAPDIVWPRAATPAEVEQFNQSQRKATNAPAK